MQTELNTIGKTGLFLATVVDKLDGVIDHQVLVRPGHQGTLDPMIDRWRVPGLLRDFYLAGRILGRRPEDDCFDLERIECACLGRDGLLPDDLGSPGLPPDIAVIPVDVLASKAPARAGFQWRRDSRAVMRPVFPGH